MGNSIKREIIENFKLIDEKFGKLYENIKTLISEEIKKQISHLNNLNFKLEKLSNIFKEKSESLTDKIVKLDNVEKEILNIKNENRLFKNENDLLKEKVLILEKKVKEIEQSLQKQAGNLQSLEKNITMQPDNKSDEQASSNIKSSDLTIKKDGKVVNITINL